MKFILHCLDGRTKEGISEDVVETLPITDFYMYDINDNELYKEDLPCQQQ